MSSSSGSRTSVLFENESLRVLHRKRTGSKRPAYVTIARKHPETEEWSQGLRLTIDELFDLTEVLDDLCDDIEDKTYRKAGS